MKTSQADTSKNGGDSPEIPFTGGEAKGDSTVSQTFDDVRDKVEEIRLNKDGSPRKRRARKDSQGLPSDPSPSLGAAGFTEAQVKATFAGFFSVTALVTDCNVWFLTDPEADCFVPSSTLALNQTFPSVAQSKWGSLTLASLSLAAVVIAKTLVYIDYKRKVAAETRMRQETAVKTDAT